MATQKTPALTLTERIKIIYYLLAIPTCLIWERLFGSYIGYYDWPKRPMSEYIAARDAYYNHRRREDARQTSA